MENRQKSGYRTVKVAVGTGRPGTRIAEHAGKTRFFLIYEIEETPEGLQLKEKKKIELKEGEKLHDMLHRFPIDFSGHPLEDVEIILTRSIGPGAVQKLYMLGKRAYMIEEKNPDEAIEKLMAGTLKALDPSQHHHHHDHHHGHDHHHDETGE